MKASVAGGGGAVGQAIREALARASAARLADAGGVGQAMSFDVTCEPRI